MEEKCWNVSSDTNDLVVNGNGCLDVIGGIDAKVVELRSRLMTMKIESEDGYSGLDVNIMMGDAPLYAKQAEIERVALTVPGVLAVKTTDIKFDKIKQTITYHLSVVFEQGTVEFDLDMGE